MADTKLTDILPGGAGLIKSIFNAKGDLLSASADDTPGILSVGANDTLLTPDSTALLGFKYVTGLNGIDLTAIHNNVAGEIALITEKTDPVGIDLGMIEDSAFVESELFWFLCDDDAPDTIVADNSANSHTGTLNGGKNTQDISQDPGVVGKSLLLDGVGDLIEMNSVVTGSPNILSDTKSTIAFWVIPAALPGTFQRLISFGDTSASTTIAIREQGASGKIEVQCRIAGVDQWILQATNVVLSVGVKTHIIVVMDGVEAKLYIGNVLVAQSFSVSLSKTKWFADAPLIDNARIGNLNFNGLGEISFFNSEYDDVRFYRRDITSGERATLFNSGSGTTASIGSTANQKKRVQLKNYLKAMSGQASAAFDWNSQNLDKINDIEIDGDLNHDGTLVGLYGTAPTAQSSAYTRNATVVEDRTLLASASATVTNNNNVLAALIADLQSRGFIG